MRQRTLDGNVNVALRPETLSKLKEFAGTVWWKEVKDQWLANQPRGSISNLQGNAALESAALTGAIVEGYLQAIDTLDRIIASESKATQ